MKGIHNYKLGLALGACVIASACASVLGIEELGSGTSSATGGAAGSSPSGGGGDAVGHAGGAAGASIAPTGGNATGGDVEGGLGTGGATGGAAGQEVADAASDVFAGDGGPSVVTVQGRVIDRWRHAMANVPISINGKTSTTSPTGTFSVTGVQTPYDVYLVVPASNGAYSWLYQGISRADPTLQVDTWGMPFRSAHYFDYTISSPNFPLPNSVLAGFSWGSPDGNRNTALDGPGYVMDEPSWTGPVRSTGTSHALKWTIGADMRPTGYNGYDSVATALEDTKQTTISLDLTKNSMIASGPVSGSIVRGKLIPESSDVYVTFTSGANIKVVDGYTNTINNFSYVVPTLLGATATICVQEGPIYDLPFAIVHKNGLVANQANVSIPIPDPAVLALPLQNTMGVTTSTDFSWTGANVVYLFVSDIQGTISDAHFRVLTTQKTARLPKYINGNMVPASAAAVWHVETHGPYATMNAATDVKGFVDPFDYSASIDGPVDRDGEMLMSDGRSFMTSATP